MPSPTLHHKNQGFTLIELLIIFSIATILLLFAAPNLTHFIQTQRLIMTTNDFLHTLNLARATAIRHGETVTIAPCDGHNWNKGWQIFIDHNHNHYLNPGDTLIFQHDPTPSKLLISAKLQKGSTAYTAYDGTGHALNTGTWRFAIGQQVRMIRINLVGRAQICNPDKDRSCLITSGNGS